MGLPCVLGSNFVAHSRVRFRAPCRAPSLQAVMKLVASCSIGYYFSKKGILDQVCVTLLNLFRICSFMTAPPAGICRDCRHQLEKKHHILLLERRFPKRAALMRKGGMHVPSAVRLSVEDS